MKVIGITCSRTDTYRSGMSREYSDAVIRAGAIPFCSLCIRTARR